MNCRSCGGDTDPVLELGNHRLADFRDDNEVPPSFPLNLLFCRGCGLAQLDVTVDRSLMYHERYGFKSGVNEQIRADHRSIVAGVAKRQPWPRKFLDIACNDGTLLSYVPKTIFRVGIDPVEKYADEAKQHADRVVNDFFDPKYFRGEQFDAITSISMFYDLDDPNEFVSGVESILAPEGIWVIQQNYLGDTLRLNAVDNICHEHLTYYSLISLKNLLSRHGLEVFDVEFSTVNGGCIRTYVAKRGVREVEGRVHCQLAYELTSGIDTVKPFHNFTERVGDRLASLESLVSVAHAKGQRVAIYGASTRGGTIWQACRFGSGDFVYAVDRNPEKVGKTMSSLGIPIVSEDLARHDHPDYMLASIWFFKDSIVEREAEYLAKGGKIVFPLPDVEVVG